MIEFDDLTVAIRDLRKGNDKVCWQEILLLMTLVSYAGEKGTSIYPEIEDLMRAIPWDRRTLFKWARKLQEHNLLIYEKHDAIFKFKFTLPGLPPVGLEGIIATPPSRLPLMSAIRQLPARKGR